ncbi:uncharacterized mitochondrial protein AtMg00810-like [Lathyrus oleraceus]|uniref:uncharacterized mitochondrial protein AtMg00810-like n=1 Tax=Pisum sativum TaxID=3888 RepID=UPI0021CF64AF|nr:uncharacterized mitochondrial protein AtMg00810-like [Pisum sativum]XP_050877707.1 uncharacterized mitochondrial protein AtMg00810-like [Pisum sativum]
MGFMRYFLGMKVARSKNGIVVSQQKYILDLLKETGMCGCRPAVSVVSQFMHSPFEKHLEAVYRILRYLKGNTGKGLFFKKTSERNVFIFIGADWAGSVTDRRSTSRYCTYVWGNLVTWRSKKQGVEERSSAEAEFRVMS